LPLPITKRILQNAAAYWNDVPFVRVLASRVNEWHLHEQRQGNAKKQGVGGQGKNNGQMRTSACNGACRIRARCVVGIERL
jgi:hypothetical protein